MATNIHLDANVRGKIEIYIIYNLFYYGKVVILQTNS